VARIVARHRGSIRCYEPDEGRFAFTLTLPTEQPETSDRSRAPLGDQQVLPMHPHVVSEAG
jgi:hypothetical protein